MDFHGYLQSDQSSSWRLLLWFTVRINLMLTQTAFKAIRLKSKFFFFLQIIFILEALASKSVYKS